MATEADIRLKKSLQMIAKAPLKTKFWKRLWTLIVVAYALTLWPFSMMARELLFIGRRDRLFTALAVLFAAAWIFAIAARRQDLGGDALFLVGAYLVGKWTIETVAGWTHRREIGEEDGGDGESIFAIAGVRNGTLTLTIGAVCGFLLWPSHIGGIVGPLLLLGCLTAILSDLTGSVYASAYIARERHKEEVTRLRGEVRERARSNRPRTAAFRRVEID